MRANGLCSFDPISDTMSNTLFQSQLVECRVPFLGKLTWMYGKAVISSAIIASLVAMLFYLAVALAIAPIIQATYNDPGVVYAPSHFQDARQYVYICIQGYDFPENPAYTFGPESRLSWMPIFALLQCGLHHIARVSLLYAGTFISLISEGVTVFTATLILYDLSRKYAALHALVILVPVIGSAWFYLPSVEATFLAIGMIVLWYIVRPLPEAPTKMLFRNLGVGLLGVIFILTKPNALAMLIPLGFAFLFNSWHYSRRRGYEFGLWVFAADLLIEGFKPLLKRKRELYQRFYVTEHREILLDFTPLWVSAGILLGFSFWLAYASSLSGVPFFSLRLQMENWRPAWPSGNFGEMLFYFSQAFRGIDGTKPWRFVAAWYLAAYLSSIVPAASPRVPGLIRGMLVGMALFLPLTGAVRGTDRHVLSTALVAIGWACWVAPKGKINFSYFLRWAFVIILAVTTSYVLLWHMIPLGQPKPYDLALFD